VREVVIVPRWIGRSFYNVAHYPIGDAWTTAVLYPVGKLAEWRLAAWL